LAAAPNDPDAANTIVVTGKRLTDDEARQASDAFIRSASSQPVSGQLARWNDPVCPKTVGLSDRDGDSVNQKIRQVARLSGIRVAAAKCKANLIVAFTDDGKAVVRTMVKRNNRIMSSTPLADRRTLLEGDMPLRWWYGTKIEGADGHQLTSSSAMLTTSVIEGANVPGFVSDGNTQFIDSYGSTMIGTKVRADLKSVIVVVDVNKATGYRLRTIAAYVAMVSLARIKFGAAIEDQDSILALFAAPPGQAEADDLTVRDYAYLAALYKVPVDRNASVQRASIRAEMIKRLTKP
jgi:hypothetical protein